MSDLIFFPVDNLFIRIFIIIKNCSLVDIWEFLSRMNIMIHQLSKRWRYSQTAVLPPLRVGR